MNGGDVGFFTYEKMVQPFAEAAFNNKVNEVSVATSQFGIHIIQTTKRSAESKQVQLAVMVRKVASSDKTYQDIYAQVSKFATENTTKAEFDAAVVAQKLTKRNAVVQESDQEIPGLPGSRGLIRAAFDAEVGGILHDFRESSIFELGDNFVIATLVESHEAGIAPFADVKARIELSVIKEKKADYLAEKAASKLSSSDLVAIAQSLNSDVKTVSNVSMAAFSVPGLGNEPALLGAVSALDKGKISKPIKGNNAVYIVQVAEKNSLGDQNLAAEQLRLAQTMEYRVDYQAYEALKKSAKIVDKRSKFF
jgi:peptidyl-prolyl cis-trans isomerase D